MSDSLEPTLRDRLTALVKGAAGSVPLAGGLLAELIGMTIPRLREERIVSYIRQLSVRLDQLDSKVAEAIMNDPERIDLIETGGFQAARATTDERVETIAELVSRGLQADDAELVRRKRLLGLLGELDDDELLLLNAYAQSWGGGGTEAWDKVNRPDPVHLQSGRDGVDNEQLYNLGRDNLLRLGLLRRNFGTVRRGEIPEFDTYRGDFKHNVQISELGRMLLREMGITLPYDD